MAELGDECAILVGLCCSDDGLHRFMPSFRSEYWVAAPALVGAWGKPSGIVSALTWEYSGVGIGPVG